MAAVALLFGLDWQLERAQEPATKASAKNNTLTIYNWGDYIDPELIKKFEKQTGYQVDYETFDSNEAMYTKIKQGGTHYDLAVPSDYMIAKMKKAGMLEKLDHSKLTGLSNYDSRFLDQSFDKGNQYSVPYFWGTLGIVYNDQYVDGSEIQSWNDLWNKKWRDSIMLTDSARDMMGMALAANDDSVNSTDEGQLLAAKGRLDALMPNVKAIVADEIKTYMVEGEAKLAVVYSGDAADMIGQNDHLHYVLPAGPGNLWFDNIVMPKTVKNKPAAYAFINFMSEPKNAAANAEYVGYSTPNKKALQLLPKDISGDHAWYPTDSQMARLEVYKDLSPYWTQRYNDLFLEFKMVNK
jgi:spermidine/putrescine transport system substrate-binding protein